jgi:hypothetical protein
MKINMRFPAEKTGRRFVSCTNTWGILRDYAITRQCNGY